MQGGVGGDFYDFPEVADGLRGLVIGDVAGHGVRPTLVMAMAMGVLRGTAPYADRPDSPLLQINELLMGMNSRLSREFGIVMCTMFYGILDVPRRRLEYASAGHPPPLACTGEGCGLTELKATAPPLGVDRNTLFEVNSADLRGTRRLLFYTDGLLDALGGAKAGIGRLSEILADTRGQEPKVQLEAVFEEVYSPGRSTEGRRTDDASAFLLDLKS